MGLLKSKMLVRKYLHSAIDTDLLLKDKDVNSGKKGILHRVFQKENLEYPTFLRKQAD